MLQDFNLPLARIDSCLLIFAAPQEKGRRQDQSKPKHTIHETNHMVQSLIVKFSFFIIPNLLALTYKVCSLG